MNVFLRELKAYRGSTLVWIASLSSLVVMFMAMYPAFTKDVTAMQDLLSQLPEAVRIAFNISLSNFFTIFGFYAYLLNFATVAAGIQAMNIGTGVISKEYSGKTADFLLSKPISRTRVLTAKLTASFVVIAVTAAGFGIIAYLAALVASEEPFSAATFVLITLTVFLVQLFFWALGAVFAVSIPKIKSVVSVSLPTVFAFFIIGTLGDIVGAENVRYLSPFKFFDTLYIINNTALESRYLLLEAALVVVLIAAAYVIFIKKDVQASS